MRDMKTEQTIAQFLGVTEFPFKIKDKNGKVLYEENSSRTWYRSEYDSDGNEVYFEDSDGFWHEQEFDSNGNVIFYKDSDGYWCKSEFDSIGNPLYYENSNGTIVDNRPKTELTLEEIAEKFNIPVDQLRIKD